MSERQGEIDRLRDVLLVLDAIVAVAIGQVIEIELPADDEMKRARMGIVNTLMRARLILGRENLGDD